MREDVKVPNELEEMPVQLFAPKRRWRWRLPRGSDGPPRPRLRKLRFLLILIGFTALAFVSTVFGMMMAVASDLPQLENKQQYRAAANSFLYDDHWRPIGLFAPPNHAVIDSYDDISSSMKDATVAIEDKRFWSDPGIDLRGIGRAFLADVTGGSRQGASTIAQQFVKNALSEQNNRTVFEKLREAALAYHLTRRWPKEKILTEYLNSIYFGNGAYGVESAARVYFGKIHGFDTSAGENYGSANTDGGSGGQTNVGCGDSTPTLQRPKCASVLAPWESALLAGMIASPSAFDPVGHPDAARARRNLVLKDMLNQGFITAAQYQQGITEPLPTANDIQQPSEPTAAPYFTAWLRPQILSAMGLGHGVPASVAEYRAYYGGLKIRTSLDLQLQQAAEQAVTSELPPGSGLPSVSLVAIDNKTGEVRAMVGGQNFDQDPFNLATEGHRQPGSAFKPFTLAEALWSGDYTPDSIITSAPQDFIVPNSGGKEHFIVHNFGNTYSGPITLTQATTVSDNSVYSQVGIHTGPSKIANLARRMGIRSPVSDNYAMILGAMKEGVTPLDLAHAYETFATGGNRVFNPQLGSPDKGPTGIAEIQCPSSACNGTDLVDKPTYQRVLPATVAHTVHDILTTVVQSGTGTSAAISGVDVAGKTGTTSDYGDAWFVGWTPQMTTAVWVGYPNSTKSMSTLYNGGPVEGGTFPAVIWQNFMSQALQILATEAAQSGQKTTTSTSTQTSAPNTAGPSPPTTAPSGNSGGGSTGSSAGNTGNTGGGAAGGGNTGPGNGGGNTGPGNGGGNTDGGPPGNGPTGGGITGRGTGGDVTGH